MSNFHLVFFENYEYNGHVPQLYRVAARKSWAPVGEGKYQHVQILGRVSRPRQGDTVSPRRGLKFPAAIQMFGRASRLTASMKPLIIKETLDDKRSSSVIFLSLTSCVFQGFFI